MKLKKTYLLLLILDQSGTETSIVYGFASADERAAYLNQFLGTGTLVDWGMSETEDPENIFLQMAASPLPLKA